MIRSFFFWSMISVLLVSSGLISCSRFDQTTDLGRDVLTDLNPGITDTVSNAVSFVSDVSIVTDSFSIPDANSASALTFGLHKTLDTNRVVDRNGMAVGRLYDEQAYGYTEFRFFPDTGKKTPKRYLPKDTLVSVTLNFSLQVDQKNGQAQQVQVNYVPQKTHTEKLIPEISNSTVGIVKIGSPDAADSGKTDTNFTLTLSDSLAKEIFTARVDSSSQILKRIFSFSYKPLDNKGIIYIRSISDTPFVVLNVRVPSANSPDTSIVVHDTISCRYSDYSVYEDSLSERSARSISSIAAQRTAVFKVDLTKLWNTMNDSTVASKGYPQILTAAFTLKDPKVQSDDTVLQYQYTFSQKLFSSKDTLDANFIKRKADVTQTITIPVQDFLQSISDASTRPQYAYLYLQVESKEKTWGVVRWNKPSRFEAILTNFR